MTQEGELAIELVRAKIKGSQRTLNSLPITPAVDKAIDDLEKKAAELKRGVPDVSSLMLLEAQAATTYFQAWRHLALSWKGTGRHPIPPQWRQTGECVHH